MSQTEQKTPDPSVSLNPSTHEEDANSTIVSFLSEKKERDELNEKTIEMSKSDNLLSAQNENKHENGCKNNEDAESNLLPDQKSEEKEQLKQEVDETHETNKVSDLQTIYEKQRKWFEAHVFYNIDDKMDDSWETTLISKLEKGLDLNTVALLPHDEENKKEEIDEEFEGASLVRSLWIASEAISYKGVALSEKILNLLSQVPVNLWHVTYDEMFFAYKKDRDWANLALKGLMELIHAVILYQPSCLLKLFEETSSEPSLLDKIILDIALSDDTNMPAREVFKIIEIVFTAEPNLFKSPFIYHPYWSRQDALAFAVMMDSKSSVSWIKSSALEPNEGFNIFHPNFTSKTYYKASWFICFLDPKNCQAYGTLAHSEIMYLLDKEKEPGLKLKEGFSRRYPKDKQICFPEHAEKSLFERSFDQEYYVAVLEAHLEWMEKIKFQNPDYDLFPAHEGFNILTQLSKPELSSHPGYHLISKIVTLLFNKFNFTSLLRQAERYEEKIINVLKILPVSFFSQKEEDLHSWLQRKESASLIPGDRYFFANLLLKGNESFWQENDHLEINKHNEEKIKYLRNSSSIAEKMYAPEKEARAWDVLLDQISQQPFFEKWQSCVVKILYDQSHLYDKELFKMLGQPQDRLISKAWVEKWNDGTPITSEMLAVAIFKVLAGTEFYHSSMRKIKNKNSQNVFQNLFVTMLEQDQPLPLEKSQLSKSKDFYDFCYSYMNREYHLLSSVQERPKFILSNESNFSDLMTWCEQHSDNTYLKSLKGKIGKKEQFKKVNEKTMAVVPDVLTCLDELGNDFPHFHEVTHYIKQQLSIARLRKNIFYISPVLLVGPPGIGKTYYFNRLASLFDNYVGMIAMGSVMAPWALSGMEPSWSGATSGFILTEMLKQECSGNPIFILDEIDKCVPAPSKDTIQSPLNALLSLLEKETAQNFRDVCVQELPIDCSYISYVATANDINDISDPILSRFKVISVPSPNLVARQKMAQSIFKKCLKDLDINDIFSSEISDDVMNEIAKEDDSVRDMRRFFTDAIGLACLEGKSKIELGHLQKNKPTKTTWGFSA